MQVTPAAVRILAELVEEFTGQELTQTRQWRVGTALSSVMREHGCADRNALACATVLRARFATAGRRSSRPVSFIT